MSDITTKPELTNEELFTRLSHANRVLKDFALNGITGKRVQKIKFVGVDPISFEDVAGTEKLDFKKYSFLVKCVWERFNAYKFSSAEKAESAKTLISSRIKALDAFFLSTLVETAEGDDELEA